MDGCFDILHPGHVAYLEQAKSKADVLVIALNTDASVKLLKGPSRPLNNLKARQQVVAALASVDYVTHFSSPTPLTLIKQLKPDLVIKGGDWQASDIVGKDFLESYGGTVLSIKFIKGFSTTATIKKIKKR